MPDSTLEENYATPTKQPSKPGAQPKKPKSNVKPATTLVPATVKEYFSTGDRQFKVWFNVGTKYGVYPGMKGYFVGYPNVRFKIEEAEEVKCWATLNETQQFLKDNKSVIVEPPADVK